MDEALHLGRTDDLGRGSRHSTAYVGMTCLRMSISQQAFPQFKARLTLISMGAPSRIRTCAHGSGVRLSNLSNLCPLPARTRSCILPPALTIPYIFRIMNTSAVTARTLQGMARARAGQAPAWPLVLTGVSAVVSRIKRDFACTSTRPLPPVLVVLLAQSRLGLEGRAHTLSGRSPDLTSSVSGIIRYRRYVLRSRSVGLWICL
jgi:hypothetical protein